MTVLGRAHISSSFKSFILLPTLPYFWVINIVFRKSLTAFMLFFLFTLLSLCYLGIEKVLANKIEKGKKGRMKRKRKRQNNEYSMDITASRK